MASWKKVIVSGSQAHLAAVTASNLTDDRLVYSDNGGILLSSNVQINDAGHLIGQFSGSHEFALEDGNGIVGFSYDGGAAATVAIDLSGSTLTVGSDGVAVNAAGVTEVEIASTALGNGLTGGSGTVISADLSGSTLTVGSDGLAVAADGITAAEIADGSISTAMFSGSALVTESEGIASSDNDESIATVAAIKDYVDAQVGGATLHITGSGGTEVGVDLNDEDLIFAGESGVMSVSASVADGDVTITTAIVDGGVGTAKLADNAVTTDKITDGNVTNAKLATSGIRFSGSGISTDATVALGATASIDLNVDDSTVEVNNDVLRVKALGIDTEHLAAGAVETLKIADGNVTNAKLANDGLMLGTTDISLGATGSTLDGLTLTGTIGSGSFSGSFEGDGSGLTGLATNLQVSSSANNGLSAVVDSIDLKTEGLLFAGTDNEVKVEAAATADGNTVTIGLPDNVTIQGDLTVLGTRTELQVEDLVVKDHFIFLASGSSGATDGGIIVEGSGSADGHGFGWDTSYVNGESNAVGRWGFDNAIASGSNSMAPSAYAAAVVTNDNDDTYRAVGNIRIDTSTEDIYIYS